MDLAYDVIVVGAGSAGCVVANRLSSNPGRKVLLLEAGPQDHHPFLSAPAGFAQVFGDPRFNWSYLTEPEPNLGGRRIYWPRGRVLGGSSSINAMVYLRGHARDYDGWARAGNPGWGWRDVLPYFRRSEHFESGITGLHGRGGELWVSEPALRHSASHAFLAATAEAGIPTTQDLNDGKLGGAGFLHFTIRSGRRCSASQAFITPVRSRRNLHVVTSAHVMRIDLVGGRARGVTYRAGGRQHSVTARETILCAGAINTPQILMLSGLGPAAHLRELGIPVAHDLPGVGQGLQDHLYVTQTTRVTARASMNAALRPPRLFAHALRYAVRRDGVLALGASQISAFVRSRPDLDVPDLQVNFTPLSYSVDELGRVAVDACAGVTTAVAHLAPAARGAVTLASPDPTAPPRVHANYLGEESDRLAMIEGLRWIGRLWAQPSLRALAHGPSGQAPDAETDAMLLDYIRANAGSLFHPVGTCRMGPHAGDVVDASLRVRGVPGLRVADASIMPTIVSGNTNAAAIMIGEKAADLIAADLRNRGL